MSPLFSSLALAVSERTEKLSLVQMLFCAESRRGHFSVLDLHTSLDSIALPFWNALSSLLLSRQTDGVNLLIMGVVQRFQMPRIHRIIHCNLTCLLMSF